MRGARPESSRRATSTIGRRTDPISASAASLRWATQAGLVEVAHHHRERLVVVGLAPAQLGHRLRVRRVD